MFKNLGQARGKPKLIKFVDEITNTREDPPEKSVFKFENTNKAVEHNAKILQSKILITQKS